MSGIVAAGITTGAAAASSKRAQKFAKKEAKRSRKFTERMSSTAYQRTMQDLEAAGLNPILAYKQGGADTGGSAQAQAHPAAFGDLGSTAVKASKAAQEMKNLRQARTNMKTANLEAFSRIKLNEANEHRAYSARGLDLVNAQYATTQRQMLNLQLTAAENDAYIAGTAAGKGMNWTKHMINSITPKFFGGKGK